MQLSDEQLSQSLQNGDEAVFEQLFRHYYSRLCSYACSIVKDMDESEEIVQQSFLGIWEKKTTLHITGSVKSYLYRAVHNACLNKLKHAKVRQLYAEDYQRNNDDAYEHTDQVIGKSEIEKQILNAINSLPEQCRMVFKLSRFEEIKYAEIARHLGISIKTVENHMGKALKLMREQLKEYLPVIAIIMPWLFRI